MQDDEYEAAPKCWEKCGGAIDGASQHRGEDEPQDGIERRLLRKKSTISTAHDDKRRHENDYPTKTDLKEGEVCRLTTQPEKRFEMCDHSRHLSPSGKTRCAPMHITLTIHARSPRAKRSKSFETCANSLATDPLGHDRAAAAQSKASTDAVDHPNH